VANRSGANRLEKKRRQFVPRKIAFMTILFAALCAEPVWSQDYSRLAFDIGGGISTPLNPTAQYIGISGKLLAPATTSTNTTRSSANLCGAACPPP
jgi:hypothetical protein